MLLLARHQLSSEVMHYRTVEKVQSRAIEMMEGLVHLSYKKGLGSDVVENSAVQEFIMRCRP